MSHPRPRKLDVDNYRGQPPKSQEVYPTRPSGFAFKFGRLLAKCAAAQEIGTVAAYLLRVIADQEDATRYRRAITFWDPTLLEIVGCSSQKTLAAARTRAVDAGWLHYEHGARGRAGRYWVLIPPQAAGISDEPIDDCQWEFSVECDVKNTSNRESNRGRTYGESGDDQGTNVRRNGQPFLPNTLDNTKDTIPEESARSPGESVGDVSSVKEIPEYLHDLIEAWNSLPDGIAPKVTKPDSPVIMRRWAKATRDPEFRPLLEDIPALMDAIRGCPFLHGQGWFKFVWLFGKDHDRITWNITKITGGNYAERPSNAIKQPSKKPSSSVRFDASEFSVG